MHVSIGSAESKSGKVLVGESLSGDWVVSEVGLCRKQAPAGWFRTAMSGDPLAALLVFVALAAERVDTVN